MITRFQVSNYKALRDVTLDLGRIHVLIGANDSGKTSILEAISALCRSVDHQLPHAFMGRWKGRELVWRQRPESTIDLSTTLSDDRDEPQGQYDLSVRFTPSGRGALVSREQFRVSSSEAPINLTQPDNPRTRVFEAEHQGQHADQSVRAATRIVANYLAGARTYRWVPSLLALPVAPDSTRRFAMDTTGFGLALVLDDILGHDRTLFSNLEDRFCGIFREFKSIKLIREQGYRSPYDQPEGVPTFQSHDGKGIHFELSDSGQMIPAAQVSDGVMLVLAYLAVLYVPEPPRVLTVEEPENGIHPGRLREVLKIVRDLVNAQPHTQVILTTHSPYVLDLFEPSEVSLCTKDSEGAVHVHRLSESKTVQEQIDVFSLGEIWAGEGDAALAASATEQDSGS